jgi:hypothetical protein
MQVPASDFVAGLVGMKGHAVWFEVQTASFPQRGWIRRGYWLCEMIAQSQLPSGGAEYVLNRKPVGPCSWVVVYSVVL